MLWTMQYGKGRSKHILGSTNTNYWCCISIYLTLYCLAIYIYNLRGVPTITWSMLPAESIPIGLEKLNYISFQKNFIQVYFHFFSVMMASITSTMM